MVINEFRSIDQLTEKLLTLPFGDEAVLRLKNPEQYDKLQRYLKEIKLGLIGSPRIDDIKEYNFGGVLIKIEKDFDTTK